MHGKQLLGSIGGIPSIAMIVTKGAEMTLEQETDYTLEQLYALADEVHD